MKKAGLEPSRTGCWTPAPSIRWIVEEKGVRIFHARKGELFFLEYPAAAVWDLLLRDPGRRSIVPKLAAILGRPEPQARSILRSCLRRFADAGILRRGGPRG